MNILPKIHASEGFATTYKMVPLSSLKNEPHKQTKIETQRLKREMVQSVTSLAQLVE